MGPFHPGRFSWSQFHARPCCMQGPSIYLVVSPLFFIPLLSPPHPFSPHPSLSPFPPFCQHLLKPPVIVACLALHSLSMRKYPPHPIFSFVISKPCNSSFAKGCGKCPFGNVFLCLVFVILRITTPGSLVRPTPGLPIHASPTP